MKRFFRMISTVLATFLVVSTALCPLSFSTSAKTLAEQIEYQDTGEISDLLLSNDYYSDYLKSNKNWENAGEAIVINPASFIACDGDTPKIINTEEIQNAVEWREACLSVSYEVDIPADALYELWIHYLAPDGNGMDIVRGLQIDGEYPFDEAVSITFPRLWTDSGKPVINSLGDELRPAQIEVRQWTWKAAFDNQGMYSSPFKIALSAGRHKITLKNAEQPVIIGGIELRSPEAPLNYEQIKSDYPPKSTVETLRFEAESIENIQYKSSFSILTGSSSNATLTPKSTTKKIFNLIGGSNWNRGGQSVTWSFNVKKTGLYKIALRALQNGQMGLHSLRRIEIDGELPFAGMEAYSFPYNSEWQTHVLSSSQGDEYLFNLEKGKHTITLTAVLGPMSDLLRKINLANSQLSNTYQNIVMITGQSPDLNYDYELDKSVPTLVPQLKEIVKQLEEVRSRLAKITSKTTTIENSIGAVINQINRLVKNTDLIPSALNEISAALTNMGDWLTNLKAQPLALDYITIASPEEKISNPKQSFFDMLFSTFTNLYISFFKDYNAIGDSEIESGNQKALKVWVARGKEWAEMLRDLTDSDFTAGGGAPVQMNILPESALSTTVNTLLLSLNAGNAPDVVLGLGVGLPAEYAVRGAIYDLSSFSDFEDISKRFPDGSFKHLEFENKVFALPETMNFRVLFYRSDIFEKLHLSVPNTWDDVYNTMLPKLNQYNQQMHIPVDYNLYLFQMGGRHYRDNGKRTALDSTEAFEAFERLIGNYIDFGIPYSANFYNRFRTGEMPVGIGGLDEYMQISFAAPELVGKWDIAPIPGTPDEDGINRSIGNVVLTASAIMSNCENPEAAWDFLKWWSSASTQTEYGLRVESVIGLSTRWATANTEAFGSLPWKNSHGEIIGQSREWIQEVPFVLGGYFTARHITNAIARCITGGQSPRHSLEEAVKQINVELQRKRENFGITD